MTSRIILILLASIISVALCFIDTNSVAYAAWVIVWAIFLAAAFIVPGDQK